MYRSELLVALKQYGFMEIGEAINFLHIIAADELRPEDKQFILCKIIRCLHQHNDGSDYFVPLMMLKQILEEEDTFPLIL